MAKKKSKGASLADTLKTLDAALATYAPKRHKKIKGTTKLDALAKQVAIPEDLRALWAWADGADGIVLLESRRWQVDAWVKDGRPKGQYPGALDLFSAATAAKQLAAIREAEEDQEIENAVEMKLVPFAGEQGSGDCLVVDAKGRVHYWSHEEPEELDEVDGSLAELFGRTVQAIEKNELFGGPER